MATPARCTASEVENRDGLPANVIQFSKLDEARNIPRLGQEWLDQLMAEKVRLREQSRKVEELEKYAIVALRSGAFVEPGAHKCYLITVSRRAHRVSGCKFRRLVIT